MYAIKSPHDLTSNSSHSPWIMSASNIYSASYDAYMAFDRSKTTYWATEVGEYTDEWLQIYSTIPIVVAGISFSKVAANGIKDFKFQGSNDGSNFIDLISDTLPNIDDLEYSFICSNNKKFYLYHRLYITNAYGTANISIREFALFGFARSAYEQYIKDKRNRFQQQGFVLGA